MGIDGDSKLPRNIQGHYTDGSASERWRQTIRDALIVREKRPQKMLEQWADDFGALVVELQPQPGDRFLLATGDDFVLLALAKALRQLSHRCPAAPPLTIDAMIHFALTNSRSTDAEIMRQRIAMQLSEIRRCVSPHQLSLHGTTDSLSQQYQDVGVPVRAVPYPVRATRVCQTREEEPIRGILAGMPRAEKGARSLAGVIDSITDPWLKSGAFRLSMQMPVHRWKSLIPKSLHANYVSAVRNDVTGELSSGPFEIRQADLSPVDYHNWLDTADVGLFLYEPYRYEARCSGVLLELLARGIPVIVPDRCWLADQVHAAGEHRGLGMIYRNRDELPGLIETFRTHRREISQHAIQYSDTVRRRHCGIGTLQAMGITPLPIQRRAA